MSDKVEGIKAAGIKVPSTVHKNSLVHSTGSTMYYVHTRTVYANSGPWVPGPRILRSTVYNTITKFSST